MTTASDKGSGPALRTLALCKAYGHQPALRGIDMVVQPGTVFGMIGPNGAGKTTTIRLLLDLIRPSSGSAEVLGLDPRRGGPALRRQIGYVPGDLRLNGRLTGRTLLEHLARISGPVAPTAIPELAERLRADLARPVRTLSKGNKQKLGLIQAFMHRPPLLILDEPTAGLDPLIQQEFLAMVRQAAAAGQTVFLSSHVLSEVQAAAHRVAVLRDGLIVATSDVEDLRETAVRRVRLGLMGADFAAVRAALSGVPHVSDLRVDPGPPVRLSATVEGSIDPFIKAIAAFTVADLLVEEPDLEESVLRLYQSPEATDAR